MTLPGWAVIHRDSLALGELMIDGSDIGAPAAGATLKINDNGIRAASVAYDIDETSSPFVEGSQVTQDQRGMVEEQWTIQCRAPDQATLINAIGVLVAAVTQRQFQVDLVIGGTTYSYTARRKAYSVPFDRTMVFSNITIVPVTFDRYPTPLAGPF
jgi:hypothetical protein